MNVTSVMKLLFEISGTLCRVAWSKCPSVLEECMYCLHLQACGLAYSSTPKTEAVLSSETLVNFYQTARYYIPDDGTVLEIVYLLSIY